MDTPNESERRPATPAETAAASAGELQAAELAWDQAHDLYKAAVATGDAGLIREADEAMGRASARLDAAAGVKCCPFCNEPVSAALAAVGVTLHSRCETAEALDSMTDEEFEAITSERPLSSREAA